MKKHYLALCLSFVIGFSLIITSSAFAAVGDKIEATITKLLFVVNGEEKELVVDPIIVNGTTYLPVRTVANLFGYDVTYLAGDDLGTIEFTKTEESFLAEMEMILGKEGPSGDENMTINEQLKEINKQIYIRKRGIEYLELDLKYANPDSIIYKTAQEMITLRQQEISDLEAQKAELEAQLEQQKAEP